MISNMSNEAKEFLKGELKKGKIYTCPIFPIGPVYSKAIKEVSIEEPYGKPCVKKHASFFSRLLTRIIAGIGRIL